jgi:hypothetical protein
MLSLNLLLFVVFTACGCGEVIITRQQYLRHTTTTASRTSFQLGPSRGGKRKEAVAGSTWYLQGLMLQAEATTRGAIGPVRVVDGAR